MTFRLFLVFFSFWVVGCAVVLEPLFIAPLFESSHGLIQLALLGDQGQAIQGLQSPATQGISMDHLRVLCLLYFGLPVAVYLFSHREAL